METKTKLELNFLDGINKNFKITVDNPKDDLEASEIKLVGEDIIENDIFESNSTSLSKLGKVNKIITQKEEIEI